MVKVGLIKPELQLCYANGIQLVIVDVIYKEKYSSLGTFNEEMYVQNEEVAEVTNETHENDLLPNDELNNDEINEDGIFSYRRNRCSYEVRRSYVEKKKGCQTFKNF